MTGYQKVELIGKKQSILKHPQIEWTLYEEMWDTLKSKRVWSGKIKSLRKDGTTFFQNTVIVPIINDRDEIIEVMSVIQDITDLYNQEQYLKKRIQDELEKNLQEAKFGTIGRMAAGITHEINTPLTYVRGNLELMLQDIQSLDTTVKQREFLLEDANIVLGGVNRIANIVESMREMASQSKEAMLPANVYASLVTALTLSYSKSKQITQINLQNEPFNIVMEKEKYTYTAMMQTQRIEQVWVIIINNAVDVLKHIDDYNKRLLEITIVQEEDNIVVRFQDNGGGIDSTMLPKIFDPFESNKEEGGIGIGLNVAKRIIEDHKGKILASNYGEGALFEVYLPVACC